ncbi:tetratricopeptide repeat protein [Urechidicola vernalis]|uniref:Uncharacterized protein n=1 Tax=Urechidicola vernalis TaxID=3075600 RepID=A0ABU2Y2U7_9FLAO|nr:hypothetical protein [Urechidicola sp. P050]MDT0552534.1 hypothetical protein [Urechidicola sp. P050]
MEQEIKSKKFDKKRVTKTLQFFAAYLVAAWTLLQFVDWVLIRYNISPYWVDLLLWIFIGIIPSLIIYLYNQERINNRVLKLREKIIFPVNIILILVITYFGFGNSDLGATTKTIAYTSEEGNQASAVITKEEFRTGFPIYNFEPKTKDSTKTWLEFGISILLQEDLLQNKNLDPKLSGIKNTVDKVNNAKIFNDFYVDGEFEFVDGNYTITTFIRNSKNAKIIAQETFNGNDVLNIIDNITVFVTGNFASNEFNTPTYLDLDVKEFASNSLKALEYYRNGDYENATKEDSTFALAYLQSAKKNLIFSVSKFEERNLADKAYKYRSKLPLQRRGETLIFKNLAYDAYEDAEELIKLQLQVDPNDQTYNYLLYTLYGRSRNLKAFFEHALNSYEKRPSINNGYNLNNAGLINEKYDEILKKLSKVELLLPANIVFSLQLKPQLFKGDIVAAENTLAKMKLLNPEDENLVKVYDKAITFLKNHKVTKDNLKKFEGEYRVNGSEQTSKLWVEKNTLLRYVSNQTITPMIMAGENTIVAGAPNNRRTWENTFLKDDKNKYYLYKNEENDFDNSYITYSWKVDKNIKKAEALFEAKKLDSAKIAYEIAIKANQKHYYLKDVLAHINYVKSIDSETLQNQFKDVVGNYGPRIFWVENGKLFYKREGFPKIEMLPITKDRYINMTKFENHFAFEYANGNVIESVVYRYDIEKEIWFKLENKGNIFKKD